jgi:hypothetical protein
VPTFRISRGGSFAGLGSLDPFGSSRGGLGRYQMTDVASLNATEAYAVAVGWQNGTVPDAAYLASLEKALSLETTGSIGWITAKNKLEDAQYTIARNALVNQVNVAASSSARIAATEALLAHDQMRLNSMAPDNEQQRELQYRILSSQADLRQTRYGDMVEQLNAGFLTTDQLIEYVKGAMTASVGAPDADDWKRTMDDLVGRKNDEYMAVLAQDYQQGRDPQGKKFLAAIDAQLGLLVPGSPKYEALARQREDLTKAIRSDTLATAHADIYDRWQRGKITDAQYLKDLERAVKEAPAGSRERADAEQRLVMTRFSLAEDKLRDDVNKGKASVGQLIRFYESTMRSMVPGSQRARQIAATIRDLKALGGSGGGGGSGDGEPKGTIKGIAKVIFPGEPWKVVAGATKDVNGRPIPKGSILSALSINASNSTERGWFNKNVARLDAAEQLGATTWLFLDKNGNEFEVAYSPDLHRQFLTAGIAAWDAWRMNAPTAKAALQAAGERFSKEKALARLNRGLVMDEYGDRFAALERDKQDALLTGNIATYIAATRQQQLLIRDAGGIEGDPSIVSTSRENMTSPLTPEQFDRLSSDIDKIAPFQPDPLNPDDPLNMDGDRIMWAIETGVLTYDQYQGVDGTPAVRNVQLHDDVAKGTGAYWTQNAGGQTVLVTPFDRPTDFAPVTRIENGQEVMAFAYRNELSPVITYNDDPSLDAALEREQTGTPKQNTQLWLRPSQSLTATVTAVVTTFSGGKVIIGGPNDREPRRTSAGPGQPSRPQTANTARTGGLRFATGQGIPLYSQKVFGWIPDGAGGWTRGYSTWVSVEPPGSAGAIWLRLSEGGTPPTVMLDPDLPTRFGQQPSATFGFQEDGSLGMYGADGKVGPLPAEMWKYTRFWRVDDARGAAEVGTGAKGLDFDWTISRYDGAIDTWRPLTGRPERESRDTIGTNGEMIQRPYNEVAATVAQRAARLARARGTGGARNVDRDSYYDPVSKRWKSDLVPASSSSNRGIARDRWYEDDMNVPPPDLSAAGRLRGILGSSTLQGAITPGMIGAAKLRTGPLPVGVPAVNSVPGPATFVPKGSPTVNPATGFTISPTVRPVTPTIRPVTPVDIKPRAPAAPPPGSRTPVPLYTGPLGRINDLPATVTPSPRPPTPSRETPVLRPVYKPVPK